MKTAFVLGGGSIKGAYQIGQMHTLIHKGIIPNVITGISVGSLNGLLYTNFLGEYMEPKSAIDKCVDFWMEHITEPSDILKEKSIAKILLEIITKNFKGLVIMDKLTSLVINTIRLGHVNRANVDLYVGAVNMNNGTIRYTNKRHNDIKVHTLASTKIPLMMEGMKISSDYFMDGGLIDNAAIGKAIKLGATDIRILVTNPEKVSVGFDEPRSLLDLIDRVMEITVNNTLNNDIELVNIYNNEARNNFGDKILVDAKVYRPSSTIGVNIESFDKEDIARMIQLGKDSIHE